MSTPEQLQTVKEYIAKYSLEDELSNAVNEAIKRDSDDPYRVISDYLRGLAKDKEDDDYEDDDDDVMAEGEEPVMRPPVGRRQQVAAKKFEVPENWVAPIFPKSDEQKSFLEGVMKSNKLMKNLAPSDQMQLADAFELVDFPEGHQIITQGDSGDSFYVLADGTCDISINSMGSVMKATSGIAFGELALLHGAPRAATVTCETPVKAYKLDEITFKMILMGKSQDDQTKYEEFLKGVPILKGLKEEELRGMAGALKEEVFDADRHIICEGDEGNTFYIIRSGEVKCTKVGQPGEVSKRLTEGSFFGELALLRDDKRAATVTAVTKTTCLCVSRAAFTRLLGKLEPPSYE